MKTKSKIQKNSATSIRRRARVLTQAVGAVLFSALFYFALIVAPTPFPTGFALPEQAVGRWALYVCLLLTVWSLAGLFADWWNALKRERSIAGTSIAPSASLETEEGAREVIGAAKAAAARYGDGELARRIEKAIARFRSSHNAAAAAEELAVDGDAALAELDASHAPARVFLYAIPILGFAGTVMAIRQILEQSALSASSTQQQPEAIRAALARTTSSLAGSFDTALLALVLSLVVMVALAWVMEKEKTLLLAVENFCRARLLPLMQPVATLAAQPAAVEAAAPREETLIGALTDLRRTLDGMARNTAETEAEKSRKLAEGERQSTEAIEKLRGEMNDAWSRHFDLAQQYLEQSQTTQKLDELSELLKARQETPAAPQQPGQPQVPFAGQPAYSAAPVANVEELGATLEDLRDSVTEMDSFLQRLAERLRSQTEEPVVVTVKMLPGASSTSYNGGTTGSGYSSNGYSEEDVPGLFDAAKLLESR